MKRKGFALQLEAVLVILMIAILAATSFFYVAGSTNRQKDQRLREMEAIRIALLKYAKNHRGAIPTKDKDTFLYKTVTHHYKYKDKDTSEEKENDQEVSKFEYETPGLFPKDLNELVELGYMEASFYASISGDRDKNGYTAPANYLTPNDYNTAAVVTQKLGEPEHGQYIYKAYTNEYDTDTAQYTKCTLEFVSERFKLGPIEITLANPDNHKSS